MRSKDARPRQRILRQRFVARRLVLSVQSSTTMLEIEWSGESFLVFSHHQTGAGCKTRTPFCQEQARGPMIFVGAPSTADSRTRRASRGFFDRPRSASAARQECDVLPTADAAIPGIRTAFDHGHFGPQPVAWTFSKVVSALAFSLRTDRCHGRHSGSAYCAGLNTNFSTQLFDIIAQKTVFTEYLYVAGRRCRR